MKDARGVPMMGAASEPFPSWGVRDGWRRPEGLRGLHLGAVVFMGASFIMEWSGLLMGGGDPWGPRLRLPHRTKIGEGEGRAPPEGLGRPMMGAVLRPSIFVLHGRREAIRSDPTNRTPSPRRPWRPSWAATMKGRAPSPSHRRAFTMKDRGRRERPSSPSWGASEASRGAFMGAASIMEGGAPFVRPWGRGRPSYPSWVASIMEGRAPRLGGRLHRRIMGAASERPPSSHHWGEGVPFQRWEGRASFIRTHEDGRGRRGAMGRAPRLRGPPWGRRGAWGVLRPLPSWAAHRGDGGDSLGASLGPSSLPSWGRRRLGSVLRSNARRWKKGAGRDGNKKRRRRMLPPTPSPLGSVPSWSIDRIDAPRPERLGDAFDG